MIRSGYPLQKKDIQSFKVRRLLASVCAHPFVSEPHFKVGGTVYIDPCETAGLRRGKIQRKIKEKNECL